MSRQLNKERTRRRLLQAIIKHIQRHGQGALTTGRVAQLAGVAQPTFYVHFRSMDEALEQVAESVASEIGPSFDFDSPRNREEAAAVLENAVLSSTRALTENRRLAEVFLCNRRDQSTPLGRRWTLLTEMLRDRFQSIVTAVRPDLSEADAALHADMLVGIVFALTEASLDGRGCQLGHAASVAASAMVTSIVSNPRAAAA